MPWFMNPVTACIDCQTSEGCGKQLSRFQVRTLLAAPIVVKEFRRKQGQKKRSRYERINTIYILTYLFRPLAHMSKRRARFDVGCLKAWW